jgi:5-methylcytosine-specific restriction endonuclease McrA
MFRTIGQILDGKKQRRRIPLNRRYAVWHRDGKRCRYGLVCDQKQQLGIGGFHLDHIKPVWYHGNDYTFNLCVACPECNMQRGKKRYIKPSALPFWRKIYGLLLMIKHRDLPKPIDFF